MKRDHFFHLLLLLLLWGWLSGCSSNKSNQAENGQSLPDSMTLHPKHLMTDSVIEIVEADTIQREEPTLNKESTQEKHTKKVKGIINQYCEYLSHEQYLNIENLFAAHVDQYITMKNTTAKIIAQEADRFLSTKSRVNYSVGYDEFIIEGNRIIFPMLIRWQGYSSRVLTEIQLNAQYNIVAYKELKVLPEYGTTQLKIFTENFTKSSCNKPRKSEGCGNYAASYQLVDTAPNERIKEILTDQVLQLVLFPDYKQKGYSFESHYSALDSMAKAFFKNFESDGHLAKAFGSIRNSITIHEHIKNIVSIHHNYLNAPFTRTLLKRNLHFNIYTGKQLKMEDMFIDNYQSPLLAISTQLLQKYFTPSQQINIAGEFLNNDKTKLIKLSHTFRFTSTHIIFDYYPFWGSLSSVEIPIPYTKIKHLLRKDTPLWNLVQHF